MKKRSANLPATDRPDADADVNAFAQEMRDVVPLEPDPRGRVRRVAPISPPRHSPQRTEHADVSDKDFVAHGVDRREIRKLKKELYEVVNVHTGKSIEQIEKDFDRDNWMTAAEAKDYGLVDEVLLMNPRKQAKIENKK